MKLRQLIKRLQEVEKMCDGQFSDLPVDIIVEVDGKQWQEPLKDICSVSTSNRGGPAEYTRLMLIGESFDD